MPNPHIDMLLARDRYRVARARSRVLSRLPPDHESLEFHVNFDHAEFVCEDIDANGEPVVHESGRLQVIGFWHSEHQRFVWGFELPALADPATCEIRDAIQDLAELDGLFGTTGLAMDDPREALDFACWVAMRLGWLGAWPAWTDDGVYLCALRLDGRPHPVETSPAEWCTTCGFAAADVALHRAAPGLAICENCVHDVMALLSDLPAPADDEAASPDFAACIVCSSTRSGNVGFTHAFVCRACAEAAAKALARG